MTGVRFLFRVTLRRHDLAAQISHLKAPQKVPVVMSQDEIKRLLAMAANIKVRTMLSLAYGCGLRAGEVVRLKAQGDRQPWAHCQIKSRLVQVMDNLGSHKGKGVRQAIRNADAKPFFLPKYSPDLNPIENFFSKLKHRLRKAAKRTIDTICGAIAQILETVTPQECRNYFVEVGYDRI